MSNLLAIDEKSLPQSWSIVTLGDVSVGPAEYGSVSSAIPWSRDLPRYVRITDIREDGSLSRQMMAGISWESARPYLLSVGDLCFARSGATVGKTYLYDSKDGVCAFAGYVIRFAINTERALPEYVSLWTHSKAYSQWVSRAIRQGAQPNINAQEYTSHRFPLPPLTEQRKIVEFLDSIEEEIRSTRRLIAKLEQVGQGLITRLLAHEVSEVGRNYIHDPVLGRVPSDWNIGIVEDFGDVRLGRQRSPQYETGPFMKPYLRVANVFDGHIDFSDVLQMNFSPTEQDLYSVRKGDILLNEGQSLELVGRCAKYDGPDNAFCFQNTLIRYRCFGLLEPDYAYHSFSWWLKIGRFADVAKQTTSIAHLGADRFARMPMVVPSKTEQGRICATLNSHVERVGSVREQLAKLQMIKQALMGDLLAGRVRVNKVSVA